MNSKIPSIPNSILSDLCTRFVMNVPDVESQDVIRIFFQVELAHWFFLDFYCQDDPTIKSCTLKEFCSLIVDYCPTLSRFRKDFEEFYDSWKTYKQAVPTYGAILLDPTLQYCLLVQGYWLKSSWSFAKGKVNQDESPIACAIREVHEETSFDIEGKIDPDNFIEKKLNEQICRLYIVTNISRDTQFNPQTRSEIRGISWFDVDMLPVHRKDMVCRGPYQLSPNQFFTAIPFIKDLKNKIKQMKSQNYNYPLYPSPTLPSLFPRHSSPSTHSCTNTTIPSNKPISKSKTQSEFFESLLQNSSKKSSSGKTSKHHSSPHPPQTHALPTQLPTTKPPPTHLLPIHPLSTNPPPALPVFSPPTTPSSTTSLPKHAPTIPDTTPHHSTPKYRLATHDIKSLQGKSQEKQFEGTTCKDVKANHGAAVECHVMPAFNFQAPAWDNFQFNVESVMAAIFES